MPHPILGLHHVTATVDHAQADLDFFVGVLGLRLVKKTVNFDNHGVYHFYYGTEVGAPGTVWTTFPYTGLGVPTGRRGVGQIRATAFSVPAGSLGFWAARLEAHGVAVTALPPRFGDEVLEARDPSGLLIELVATSRDTRAPWTGDEIGPEAAIRGLHSVTLVEASPDRTVALMTERLNFTVVAEMPDRLRLAVGPDHPGALMEIAIDPHGVAGRNGLGTVHHVAMAIAHGDEQRRVREDLLEQGLYVTDVLDRQYFQSIYFREPGGILFEVATMQPGFLIDEPRDALGRALKLPPWEESNRAVIERTLAPVRVR